MSPRLEHHLFYKDVWMNFTVSFWCDRAFRLHGFIGQFNSAVSVDFGLLVCPDLTRFHMVESSDTVSKVDLELSLEWIVLCPPVLWSLDSNLPNLNCHEFKFNLGILKLFECLKSPSD